MNETGGDLGDVYYRYKQLSQSKVKDLYKSKSDVSFDRAVLMQFRKHQGQLLETDRTQTKRRRILMRSIDGLLKKVDASGKFRE